MSKKKKQLSKLDRYDYLIKARNFHYENFNKWMTYFYVAIGALFVGFYSIIDKEEMEFEKIMLIFLGYVTSLFWYWSSKGYYFWNINFITLVNDCEENTLKLKKDERVYFVFANKKTQNDYFNPISGANISTSKIAILFSFIVACVWNILLLKRMTTCNVYLIILSSIAITLILSGILPRLFLSSKINHFPNLNVDQDSN